MAAAGRTPGRAAVVPPGVPRPMARVAVRARPPPTARAGLPVLRRTGPARRARRDAMVRVRSGPAVRQVRLLAGRALLTPAAGAPRAMIRAPTAGPRSETVRTAAQGAVPPVTGPGRLRPGLGGMPRTADATAGHLTVIPGVPRPITRGAGHRARTPRRGASALAARRTQIPALTGGGRGRRTASATARVRTAAAQGPIAAGREQSVPVLVVPLPAGRPGIEAVPVAPVRAVPTLTGTAPILGRARVAPVPAVPTLTATAPAGRVPVGRVPAGLTVTGTAVTARPPIVPVRAAPTVTGTAPAGRPRTARLPAAPTPIGTERTGRVPAVPTVTGTAVTARPPIVPVRAAPTVTGTAPAGRPRTAPTPTATAPILGRAAVALPIVLVAVSRRQALVTVRRGRAVAVTMTGRRSVRTPAVPGRARMTGEAEALPRRPTRRVRQGPAYLIRLPPTSSIPRRGPSSTACRTTWPTA
jgi:hypothetical protein